MNWAIMKIPLVFHILVMLFNCIGNAKPYKIKLCEEAYTVGNLGIMQLNVSIEEKIERSILSLLIYHVCVNNAKEVSERQMPKL
ncbi:hypothetical protein [Leptospira bandrabouensis]|uniref:hypothetical protein n=1 Tax=Leptospira bandrabouensis TaxID=2484903 RepID=UPI001EE983C1|nr:hypothetical protein [Leptospira bandrabouensis]MCG6145375.1 hypothetical protein [Leptospira bandrabouensis]MCG6160999.1 hypothetical protein [Leptospira bandrabouensis]MCG6164877.1 hypothetical protein [Leptospira bandrabouensis]